MGQWVVTVLRSVRNWVAKQPSIVPDSPDPRIQLTYIIIRHLL